MKKIYTAILCSGIMIKSLAQPCAPNTHSLQFNGNSNYVTTPYSSVLEITEKITVEAWIKPGVFGSGSAQNSIVCKHGWSQGERGFVLRCGGQGELNFNIAGVNTSGINVSWKFVSSGTNTLTLNTWTHVAGTFDGDSLRLFVNGVQIAATGFQGTIDTTGAYPLTLGKLSDPAQSQGRYFNGLMDEVRIYNRALDAAEIFSGMNQQLDAATQNGLVAYWRMNDGSGTVITDSSANQINGNINGATFNTDVPFNMSVTPSIIYPNTDTTYCSSINYTLYGSSAPGITYLWSNGGTTSSINPAVSGMYYVTITNAAGCTSVSDTVNISILNAPATPVITMGGINVLQTSATGNIQWYLNGNPITGANSTSITLTQTGNYTVGVTLPNGCSALSAPLNITHLGLSEQSELTPLSFLYDAASGEITLLLPQGAKAQLLQVYALNGQCVYFSDPFSSEIICKIPSSSWTKGVYLIKLVSDKGEHFCKFVK